MWWLYKLQQHVVLAVVRGSYCRPAFRHKHAGVQRWQWQYCRSVVASRLFSTSSRCSGVGSVESDVELTRLRYPQIQRAPYAHLTSQHMTDFKRMLPQDGQIITDHDQLLTYNVDWLKMCRGESKVVLRPVSTEQVSAILTYCNSHKLAVVPQGGNTGLVGGSVPVFDEIILSLSLMHNIEYMDTTSGIIQCGAGCILENLDNYTRDQGFIMPLDIGAKGSCQIGGNISTNAGGIRYLRYGSLHGSVLGLEVVLASGEVLDCMTTSRKDNTGYDIKQLFIGSEGTLGVITKATIQCPPKPNSVNVALLGCSSFPQVLSAYERSRGHLAEILSSFEFMDSSSMSCVVDHLHYTNPLSGAGDQHPHQYYLVVETSGSNAEHDENKLHSYLEELMTDGIVQDGTVARSYTEARNIWSLREEIAVAMLQDGYVYKYDLSVPIDKLYDLVIVMRERLREESSSGRVMRCVGYGHLGDGNLHLNITSPRYDEELTRRIEPFVYEWTSEHRGSISAEHGLGFKKMGCIHYSRTDTCVSVMRNIKQLMDPNAILNPYKTVTVRQDKQQHT